MIKDLYHSKNGQTYDLSDPYTPWKIVKEHLQYKRACNPPVALPNPAKDSSAIGFDWVIVDVWPAPEALPDLGYHFPNHAVFPPEPRATQDRAFGKRPELGMGYCGKAETVSNRSMAATGAAYGSPLRDKTSEERKAEPIHSGVLLYFPDALAAIARHSKAGNEKHNPGEPLHWARGKSADQMDSAIRHSLTPKRIDVDTKEPELVGMAWRVLAELQESEEKRNRLKGVRSYSEAA